MGPWGPGEGLGPGVGSRVPSTLLSGSGLCIWDVLTGKEYLGVGARTEELSSGSCASRGRPSLPGR